MVFLPDSVIQDVLIFFGHIESKYSVCCVGGDIACCASEVLPTACTNRKHVTSFPPSVLEN